MKKVYRNAQLLSNIATVVIAVLFCIVTIKLFTSPNNVNVANLPKTVLNNANSNLPLKPVASNPVGKSLPIENINWKENKKTLVLYISTTCRFCNESSPFYKRLSEQYAGNENIKLVAVLPQSVEESKEHLKGQGIKIDNIYNAQLSSIGVTGTPTLLLVDESGSISEFWKGKLTPEKETEVLKKLSS